MFSPLLSLTNIFQSCLQTCVLNHGECYNEQFVVCNVLDKILGSLSFERYSEDQYLVKKLEIFQQQSRNQDNHLPSPTTISRTNTKVYSPVS
uniref:Apple domain-containing protein n=1 Tax=Solanum lycopersicum TaxID=4081 RepID=A0A3Q7HQS6_SOLLC